MGIVRRPNPCKRCGLKDVCEYSKGCGEWRDWFRSYWRALRRRYLC